MRLHHHESPIIQVANLFFFFIGWIPCMIATNASIWQDIHLTRSLHNVTQLRDNGIPVQELQRSTNPNVVNMAVLFDSTDTFEWAPEIIEFIFAMINDHTDGWHDDIFVDGTRIDYHFVDPDGCDQTKATQAYWDARGIWNGTMHGVVGPRCSDATIAVGCIANLESVPHVSPSSTSPKLSNKDDFPLFSRLCAPASGEILAMISMFRSFKWDRVTILGMDTQSSKDYITEFEELWIGKHVNEDQDQWFGEVSYSATITFQADRKLDIDSVTQALDGVPTNDPNKNSRVILLVADESEAYPILQIASEKGSLQPDTIWVGTRGWTDRLPADVSMRKYSQHPGYLGLTPFRNRDDQYQIFLERVQMMQLAYGMEVLMELPDYTAEFLVDSILSVAKALGKVPHYLRRDGDLVTSKLRELTFAGVSGNVSFTPEGNRRDPRYGIYNLQRTLNGKPNWVPVGYASTEEAYVELYAVCFAEIGCNRTSSPSDKYPVPAESVESWVIAVIAVMVVLLIALLLIYLRSRRTQRDLMSKIKAIDFEILGIDDNVEDAQQRRVELMKKRAALIQRPDSWSDSRDILVEITPNDPQYWVVFRTLRGDMDDAHISKLWRIQNMSLWTYYTFQRNRLELEDIDVNETTVWHGTSGTDPSVIYNDRQDGFMMQFSKSGLWGRGIYFAEKGSYSDKYAYQPLKGSKGVLPTDRPKAMVDEREMILAKLLVGSEVFFNRDESAAKAAEYTKLMMPPQVPEKPYRFNTVSGHTRGSKVWVVYENGRAYPDYLVRYYRGSRDQKRSPFDDEGEAMRKSRNLKKRVPDVESASNIEVRRSPTVIWEFLGDSCWTAYVDSHQVELEASYQSFAVTKTSSIKAGMWDYEIDIVSMTQKNIRHPNNRERAIRRRTNHVVV